MRKIKSLFPWLISAIVFWSAGFAYNVYFGGLIGWHRKAYNNKVALAGDIKAQRRLILVGGSGVHYTFNAEYMEDELGFPVFNFGLDGQVGLDLILPITLEEIREGDIVLLIPEYLMLLDDVGTGPIAFPFALATNNLDLIEVSQKDFFENTLTLGIPGLNSLVKSGVDLITKGHFDDYYSDPLTPRGEPTRTFLRQSSWWQMTITRTVSDHSIQVIEEFKKDVENKSATLILSLPIIYGDNDEETLANVKETAEKLAKIAPIIYDEKTLNIWTSSDLFADTHYHLKPEGRIIRSDQVIEELKSILNN